ncbi:MAG: ParB N-terminal domain-containing protein [Candidatus Schekmanbacteria bacterium]|nr:ParB N-terminal domain-containing protein [Candidatus Schekmanbacteria bacterium]
MQFKFINLGEVIIPDYFENSFPELPGDILLSVEKIGIIAPVQVIESEKGYMVFSGCRRFRAAEKLNWQDIPAFIYKRNKITDFDALKISIDENRLIRGLNDFEVSNILSVLENHFKLSKEEIVKTYSRKLGIPENFAMHEKYRLLKKLDKELKSFILEKKIPLKTSSSISSWQKNSQTKFFNLIKNCLMSHNDFTEAVTLIEEIAHIQKNSTEDIIDREDIQSILRNEETIKAEKTAKILKLLRDIRSPQKENLKKNIRETEKSLSKAGLVKVKLPELLEGDEIKIEITVKNAENLGEAAGIISSDNFYSKIKNLFKVKPKSTKINQ